MRVLFVVSTPFLMEPLGALQLMAIARQKGHTVKLAVLKRHRIKKVVWEFSPDVIAYSVNSADIDLFKRADAEILGALEMNSASWPVYRIMGGPHATFNPGVLDEMGLDAVCQGDGDCALPELLACLEEGNPGKTIPNVAWTGAGAEKLEIVESLDDQPFPDRRSFYEALPYYRKSGLRSFMTGRGCPFNCSYCFNHAYNRMFSGCGKIIRRRSVDNVLEEIKQVQKDYPPLRLLRFIDDTFSCQVDPWLEEFAEKYAAQINIPYYCLMRSNTLTPDSARLLAASGCRSIGLSIEAGNENVRNNILKRGLANEEVYRSFRIAEEFGIKTYACTMLGIPGTTFEDDLCSLRFVRGISPSAPIFTLCTPYQGTDIWKDCVEKGYVVDDGAVQNRVGKPARLTCFTQRERDLQMRACYLGPLYCAMPKMIASLILQIIKAPIPPACLKNIGFSYTAYRIATRIFPQAIPRSPSAMFRIALDSILHLI